MNVKTDAQRKEEGRKRTAKFRAKQEAQKAANEAVAAEQRREERCKARLAVPAEVAASEEFLFGEYMQWRRDNVLVFPGEIAPDQNAENCADAIQVCKEFLTALHQVGIKPNETLLSAEARVLKAWSAAGGPLLNRGTRKLELSVASDAFEYDFDKWTALEGADLPITDIAALPAIVPAADTAATVASDSSSEVTQAIEAIVVEDSTPTYSHPVEVQVTAGSGDSRESMKALR